MRRRPIEAAGDAGQRGKNFIARPGIPSVAALYVHALRLQDNLDEPEQHGRNEQPQLGRHDESAARRLAMRSISTSSARRAGKSLSFNMFGPSEGAESGS